MRRLKEIREKQALSQRALADISGVAQATISLIEQGERKARPSTLRKLAEALNVQPESLLGETPEEGIHPRSRFVAPPHDYLDAMERTEGYRAKLDQVRWRAREVLQSNDPAILEYIAFNTQFEIQNILDREADRVSVNSHETWREIFSVLQDLLDLHSAADDKLATLRKTPKEVSEEEQMIAAITEAYSYLAEETGEKERGEKVSSKEHIEKIVRDSLEN